MSLEGWFRITTDRRVIGWVADGDRPGVRHRVEMVVDGAVIAEVMADTFRVDLKKQGVGDGHHGFELDLNSYEVGYGATIVGRVSGTEFELRTNNAVLAPRLHFIHIPKSGGTTFREFLESQYPAHLVLPDTMMMERSSGLYPPADAFCNISQRELNKFNLFRGHYHVDYGAMFKERPISVTVLRDPVPRAISHIRMNIRNNPKYHGMTVDEYVAQYPQTMNNMQTRYFCDTVFARPIGSVPKELRGQDIVPVSVALTDAHREQALAKLAKVEYVGVQDDLDGFARLIASTFHFPLAEELPKLNAYPDKTKYSRKTLKALREMNEYDEALYAYAKSRAKELSAAAR